MSGGYDPFRDVESMLSSPALSGLHRLTSRVGTCTESGCVLYALGSRELEPRCLGDCRSAATVLAAMLRGIWVDVSIIEDWKAGRAEVKSIADVKRVAMRLRRRVSELVKSTEEAEEVFRILDNPLGTPEEVKLALRGEMG